MSTPHAVLVCFFPILTRRPWGGDGCAVLKPRRSNPFWKALGRTTGPRSNDKTEQVSDYYFSKMRITANSMRLKLGCIVFNPLTESLFPEQFGGFRRALQAAVFNLFLFDELLHQIEVLT